MQQGMYFTSSDELLAFEDGWLGGQEIDIVVTTYSASFHSVEGITWENGVQDLGDKFGSNTSRTLAPIYWMGDSEGDYASVVAGDHDADFRQFAQDLVGLGCTDAFIRINPEFNLSWASSRYPDDPQNYADAFARCVGEMMSIDGANFRFMFSPAQNNLGVAPESWPLNSSTWPSGRQPPIVAPSFYDDWGGYDVSNVTDELRQQSWPEHHAENIGKWVDFANQRNADFGAPEWGVALEEWRHPAGGDNPWFIENVFQLLDNANAVFQNYWNGPNHVVFTSDQFPRAKEQLKTDMNQRLESDGGGDDGGDDSTEEYGGYTTPTRGTQDWHEDLNQNFDDIEADIKDLARRVKELE